MDNEFIELMKKTGIIQQLREQLSEKDQPKFDEEVARVLGEYSLIWADLTPALNEYKQKVESYGNRTESRGSRQSEGEHRQHDKSDDK